MYLGHLVTRLISCECFLIIFVKTSIRIVVQQRAMIRVVLLPLLLFQCYFTDAGQLCSSCSGVTDQRSCQHHIKCEDWEECFVRYYVTESGLQLYDMGCITSNVCPSGSISPPFIGKRSEGHHMLCLACCNKTGLCNEVISCESVQNQGPLLPRDCSELNLPESINDTYTIYPYDVKHKPVAVYCIFDYADVAWTVIQRRFDGSVNFYRDWKDYEDGFGTSNVEYWLGLENIHALTSIPNYEAKFVMTNFDKVTKHAMYSSFHIADASAKYRLTIYGYSGTAGDAMKYHDGMMFSTYDQDNDSSLENCAKQFHGGWWYNECFKSNLNGKYLHANITVDNSEMLWENWSKSNVLQSTDIMIRKS